MTIKLYLFRSCSEACRESARERASAKASAIKGKGAEIKRSGVSQRANPQNQNLREESIFKGNDVSRSSKVRQGQNLERAKPDSGHRSDISQVASPQNRDPR